jgi:hypothetical protein
MWSERASEEEMLLAVILAVASSVASLLFSSQAC